MNFVSEMHFDAYEYFVFYPHRFWLAACYGIHFQTWSVMWVSLQMTAVILSFFITNTGLIQAGNEPFTFSISLI